MLKKVVSRSTVFATIIALALASISATSVFAAGTVHNRSMDQKLQSEWKTALVALRAARLTENSIGRLDRQWLDAKRSTKQLRQEDRYADLAAADLQRAEILANKHPGFTSNGKIINRVQANQTLRSLTRDLHSFHMEVTEKILRLFSS